MRKEKLLVLSVWAACFLLLVWQLYPLLTSRLLAGWDTAGHYYLYKKMLGFLRDGRLAGYDSDWLGGYPAFVLYPPLSYVLMALPHLLSAGFISETLSFNLFYFFLPFCLLLAMHWTAGVFFGKHVALASALLTFCYLFIHRTYAHHNIGLGGLVVMGLAAGNLALIFWLLLLGILEAQRRNPHWRLTCAGGFFWGAILLTHTLMSIFTIWTFAAFICVTRPRRWGRLLSIFLLGTALGAFWAVPFFRNASFHSGQSVGSLWRDPLLVLYPDTSWPILKKLFSDPTAWFDINLPPWLNLIVYFPYYGFFLLLLALTGCAALLNRRDWFLPLTYVASLIVLPRDLLRQQFDIPIHYYRFIQPIFMLNILAAAYGSVFALRYLSEKLAVFPRLRKAAAVLFAAIITLTAFRSLSDWRGFRPFKSNERTFVFHPEDYSGYDDAEQMFSFISSLRPQGRIAVETNPGDMHKRGSPHYLTAAIPLRTGAAVVPGLLAESALSAGFINPALAFRSHHMKWGRDVFTNDPWFNRQSLSSMITRLSLFNVHYILSSSETYFQSLSKLAPSDTVLVERIGELGLFRLAKPRPFLEETDRPPLLFAARGGTDFRAFAEQWYKDPRLFAQPVIHAAVEPDQLPAHELAAVGGFVVSYPQNRPTAASELAYWGTVGKPVFILGSAQPADNPANIFFLDFKKRGEHLRFAAQLDLLFPGNYTRREIQPQRREDEHLVFDSSKGVIINLGYNPGWRSADPYQTTFWVTPSLMFVFGKGQNELRYTQ